MIITYFVLPNIERKQFYIKLFTIHERLYIYICIKLNVLNSAKSKYYIIIKVKICI